VRGNAGARAGDQLFFFGTFLPERLASERPIAIACFLLFTFLPLPLFSLPLLNSRISLSTFLPAEGEYLRDEVFFFDEELFFAVDILPVEEDFLVAEAFLREELLEDFFTDEDFFLRVDFVAIPHS
jgi:hypothetical protein